METHLPCRAISMEWMVRTVSFTTEPLAANARKSCRPTAHCASRRMASTSRGYITCACVLRKIALACASLKIE